MALAAALGREIQVAYLSIPAINAYANAKVPIKIVTGTHKYGYGLVVDSNKIKCVRTRKEGIQVDVLQKEGWDVLSTRQ